MDSRIIFTRGGSSSLLLLLLLSLSLSEEKVNAEIRDRKGKVDITFNVINVHFFIQNKI